MLTVSEDALFFINDTYIWLMYLFPIQQFSWRIYSDNSAASIFKSIRSCTTAGGFWGYLATVKYLKFDIYLCAQCKDTPRLFALVVKHL